MRQKLCYATYCTILQPTDLRDVCTDKVLVAECAPLGVGELEGFHEPVAKKPVGGEAVFDIRGGVVACERSRKRSSKWPYIINVSMFFHVAFLPFCLIAFR